jgi:hypothetical protein
MSKIRITEVVKGMIVEGMDMATGSLFTAEVAEIEISKNTLRNTAMIIILKDANGTEITRGRATAKAKVL